MLNIGKSKLNCDEMVLRTAIIIQPISQDGGNVRVAGAGGGRVDLSVLLHQGGMRLNAMLNPEDVRLIESSLTSWFSRDLGVVVRDGQRDEQTLDIRHDGNLIARVTFNE